MHEKIIEILTNEDDVTWKSILTNLVKSEEMDPWDIDISLLAKRFLEIVKTLQNMDFRMSGKIVLAAAILLRMKSSKLFDTYIKDLDSMIAQTQEIEEFYEELEYEFKEKGIIEEKEKIDHYSLIPRTPQPRKRKISLFDLIEALDKAVEVQDRRLIRKKQYKTPEVNIPKKKWDLGEMIEKIYQKIVEYYDNSEERLTFFSLINTDDKEEKIMTFMPLLHLSHQRKINLEQKEHLGDISIEIA